MWLQNHYCSWNATFVSAECAENMPCSSYLLFKYVLV